MSVISDHSRPVAIICGGGSLPFAVADSVIRRGGQPVLLGLTGVCDPEALAQYRHHWISVGRLGQILRIIRAEGAEDVVFIGNLARPAITDVRIDLQTLWSLPRIVKAFRGGDDHLLTRIGKIFEDHGLRMIGAAELAPDILLPPGSLTKREPDDEALTDIMRARAVLRALGPYDVGQAAVAIGGHIVAVEDIAGTDSLLERVTRLRAEGRIKAKPGSGVLVKAPKSAQDLRFDMPTIGPRTLEGAAAAGLAGLAAVAGQTIVAEPALLVEKANADGLFVAGLSGEGAGH